MEIKLNNLVKLKEMPEVKKELTGFELVSLHFTIIELAADADNSVLGNVVSEECKQELDKCLSNRENSVDVIDGCYDRINLWNGLAISRVYLSKDGNPVFEMEELLSYEQMEGKTVYYTLNL